MHLVEVPPHRPRLRERPAPSPPVAKATNMQRAATDVMQSIIFSAVLDGDRRAEARVGRPAQPAAARRPGDPPQRHLRRFAQGASGRDRREHARGLHPAAEGRLCGRPAPADAAVAADGPRARAPAADRRPPRTAARPAARATAAAARPPKGGGKAASRRAGGGKPRRLNFAAPLPAKRRQRPTGQTSMSSAHGCTPADEVSSAGAFCVWHPIWRSTSLRRFECSTV